MNTQMILPDTLKGGIAWAFAGQGSQVPGMGKDIYEEFPETRSIFESKAAGFDLKEICFEAPAEVLSDTRYTQACMAAFAAAVVRVLKAYGFMPDAALGLSLGEYCALHAAEVIDSDALLELLGFRGAIMADASAIPSRMTAVFGLSDEEVEQAVSEVARETGKVVSCTNYNSPGQVVIGGDEEAVLQAEELLKIRGAKRCIPLKTSGPFHTALMQEPARLLAERLALTPFSAQALPVIFNVTGEPAQDAEIKKLLTDQIALPVRFAKCVRCLAEHGITQVIEVGPGKVLSGLIKKSAPEISVVSIETAVDLKQLISSNY